MADKPLTGLTPAQAKIEKIVHNIIFDVALEGAKVAAIAQVPFLGWPVIRNVFNFIVDKLMGLVYEQLSTLIIFTAIDINVESQRLAYEAAIAELRRELSKPKEEQDEAKHQAALAEARRRLRDLIQFPR